MILRSPTEDENRRGLALTVILNAVKDLLYVFGPSKQITSRFFVAALRRMTLPQDVSAGLKPALQKLRALRVLRGEFFRFVLCG